MPASKTKKLSSLFLTAVETASKASSSAKDTTLRQFISSLDVSCPTTSRPSTKVPSKRLIDIDRLKLDAAKPPGDSAKRLSSEISSLLCGDTGLDFVSSPDLQERNNDKTLQKVLDIPWFSQMSLNDISIRRKEISRERKQKWIFKNTQTQRFERLVRMCAQKLGTDATIQVFGKLGRETGVKEYSALIQLCIEKARMSEDEEVSLEQAYKAYQLFTSMKEQGFQIEEQTYGPFLKYLIELGRIKEFQFFCGVIRDGNPNSVSRLAYYEMLFWIKVSDEDKIYEVCNHVIDSDTGDKFRLKESYLLALCESDRKKELLLLLDTIDITRVSSAEHVETVFQSLGRLLMESVAAKFILAFKACDNGAEDISNFIYTYVSSMPNLSVEDAILKFKNLHSELEVASSSKSYGKLIKYSCKSLKVYAALDIVDQMLEAGLTLSIEMFHSILEACEESFEYNLVWRIYSVICDHNLMPNSETFRIMINLTVRMKDFKGAYSLIDDAQKMNLMPTVGMYNAIMLGYFREKNIHGGLMVLKQMEIADVKPDSQTFSYLIINSDCEENIIKHYKELKDAGVQVTKHIFMALINAYAACGQYEKAKQVVLDKEVPIKSLNEIKGTLVSALASHGKVFDALGIYDEIKQAQCSLDQRAIISLIEHLQSEGELNRLLQLLEELDDQEYWIDGCFRIISYCVQYKHLRSTIDLLKQLKDKFCNDEVTTEVLLDEVFCKIADAEHPDVQFGLDVLHAVKEELVLRPSRKCLDFLLSACVIAKDSCSCHLIWKEFQAAGLPYNVLSLLRMYQALLASGEYKSARNMLNRIPKDDPHVRCIIKACQTTYGTSTSKKKEK